MSKEEPEYDSVAWHQREQQRYLEEEADLAYTAELIGNMFRREAKMTDETQANIPTSQPAANEPMDYDMLHEAIENLADDIDDLKDKVRETFGKAAPVSLDLSEGLAGALADLGDAEDKLRMVL